MSTHRKFRNKRLLNSFAERIDCLYNTVHSSSPTAKDLLCSLKTLYVIKGFSRAVIRGFLKDWHGASCNIGSGGDCAVVFDRASGLRDKLVSAHTRLLTMDSPLARWAGRRLTGPVIDWNDLILDLVIVSDPKIQSSLCELEEVL